MSLTSYSLSHPSPSFQCHLKEIDIPILPSPTLLFLCTPKILCSKTERGLPSAQKLESPFDIVYSSTNSATNLIHPIFLAPHQR